MSIDNQTKIYEAWEWNDGGSQIAFSTPAYFQQEFARGSIPQAAKLLHRIAANTWEEAMSLHHQQMGWSPYIPPGEPENCPHGCGAMFYPQGSGECPNCGKIGSKS
jgi:hypothetical protein